LQKVGFKKVIRYVCFILKQTENMEEIIKQLEQAIETAENYKTFDSGMEYAYKYGVLLGNIKVAILDLEYLKVTNK